MTPRFVFVSPDGAHLAVDWGRLYDVRRGDGGYLFGTEKESTYDLTVDDAAFYIYGNEGLWTGGDGPTVKPATGITPGGSMLAFRFDGTRRIFAMQVTPSDPHGGGGFTVQVFADRFARPDRSYAEPVFQALYPGHGVAAITADWRTAVAMDDGTLHLLAAQGEPTTLRGVEEWHVTLGYTPRWLAVVAPYLFLTSDDSEGTRVHCVDRLGAERWSATVSFAVAEPPIDAGQGRVVLAGGGLASVQDGRVLWSVPSGVRLFATAFADGTLAVAVGRELRIVDREGAVRQSFQTADGDTITTPPAIGHDGVIWVASQHSLYVAR